MPEEPSSARGGTAYGIDLKVSFACPECCREGQVAWANLARGMRCPQCGVRFWLDARGRLRSERRAPQLRFRCPRCGQQEKIPATFATRGIRCPACRERFAWGSDNAFHGQRDLEALQRATRADGTRTGRTRRLARMGEVARQNRCRRFCLLCLLCLLGVGGLLSALWPPLSANTAPRGVGACAEQFTAHCLENRLDLAEAFVDSQELPALRRWLVLNPHGSAPGEQNRYRARATLERQSPQSATVRVVLSKPGGKDSVLHTQQWHWRDGRWLFSPSETLRLVADTPESPRFVE